jgi:hypothetical protein
MFLMPDPAPLLRKVDIHLDHAGVLIDPKQLDRHHPIVTGQPRPIKMTAPPAGNLLRNRIRRNKKSLRLLAIWRFIHIAG